MASTPKSTLVYPHIVEKLPVIFRRSQGEITAVFPTVPWTATDVTCYAHVGQHSSCSRAWYNRTKRAKFGTYDDLLAELRQIYAPEYELVVTQRWTRDHNKIATSEWNRLYGKRS